MPKKKEKRYCGMCFRDGILSELKDARKKCPVCKGVPGTWRCESAVESDIEERAMDEIEYIRRDVLEEIAEEIRDGEEQITDAQEEIESLRLQIEDFRVLRDKKLEAISRLEKILYKITGDEGWISPSPQP